LWTTRAEVLVKTLVGRGGYKKENSRTGDANRSRWENYGTLWVSWGDRESVVGPAGRLVVGPGDGRWVGPLCKRGTRGDAIRGEEKIPSDTITRNMIINTLGKDRKRKNVYGRV